MGITLASTEPDVRLKKKFLDRKFVELILKDIPVPQCLISFIIDISVLHSFTYSALACSYMHMCICTCKVECDIDMCTMNFKWVIIIVFIDSFTIT